MRRLPNNAWAYVADESNCIYYEEVNEKKVINVFEENVIDVMSYLLLIFRKLIPNPWKVVCKKNVDNNSNEPNYIERSYIYFRISILLSSG